MSGTEVKIIRPIIHVAPETKRDTPSPAVNSPLVPIAHRPNPAIFGRRADVKPLSPAQDTPEKDNTTPVPPPPLSDKEVTDHTASLWKYIPVPSGEPEPAPEYLSEVKEFTGGRFIAARVRGKKHKHEGTNCDDWYETANLDGIVFCAVSDGAGSKKFSRIGAKESCEAAVGYLVTKFREILSAKPELKRPPLISMPKDPNAPEYTAAYSDFVNTYGIFMSTVQDSVMKAREAVEIAFLRRAAKPLFSENAGKNIDVRDFSSTLLVSAVIPLGKSTEHLVITCQIGDGIAAVLNTKGNYDESLKLMGDPDSGEYSGETDFLTSLTPEMLQRKTKVTTTNADILFMMTDGVADDYFPNKTELRRLYFDLVLNGIIDGKPDNQSVTLSPSLRKLAPSLSAEQLSVLTDDEKRQIRAWSAERVRRSVLKSKIPEPLAYPWVNDKEIKVPVQYSERVCEALGISQADLWNKSWILEAAGNVLDPSLKDSGKRLEFWLDNYAKRTSADDRTLVIVQFSGV